MSEELKALLSCQVCKELCKRGVSVKCCNARACRACATKEVTAKRLCWNPDCRSPVANTEDLVNDDLLRSAVGLFKQKNTLPNDVAAKVKATFGTTPSQQNQQQAATATKAAPKTAVTPTTPKPAVAPTTPKPAVAATTPKTAAKPATPKKGATPATPKKGATPATPKAAASPVAPKPVFSLKAPYTPKLAAAVKTSPNAAASPKSAAVTSLAGQKRKSDLAGNGKVETTNPKKIAPEFEYKYVIMDMQIVMSGHRNGFVHQMALLHKPNNGPPQQVFIPVADPNVPFIRRLPESHRQAIGSRDSKENSYKLVFMRKGKEETYVQGLDPAYGRLAQFCTSLKSSDRTKIVVVVYSDRMFNIMNKFFFKPHDPRQALAYCFDEVLTLTPLNHKFNTVFDEVPVHEVLGVNKGADCSESVQLISSVFQRNGMFRCNQPVIVKFKDLKEDTKSICYKGNILESYLADGTCTLYSYNTVQFSIVVFKYDNEDKNCTNQGVFDYVQHKGVVDNELDVQAKVLDQDHQILEFTEKSEDDISEKKEDTRKFDLIVADIVDRKKNVAIRKNILKSVLVKLSPIGGTSSELDDDVTVSVNNVFMATYSSFQYKGLKIVNQIFCPVKDQSNLVRLVLTSTGNDFTLEGGKSIGMATPINQSNFSEALIQAFQHELDVTEFIIDAIKKRSEEDKDKQESNKRNKQDLKHAFSNKRKTNIDKREQIYEKRDKIYDKREKIYEKRDQLYDSRDARDEIYGSRDKLYGSVDNQEVYLSDLGTRRKDIQNDNGERRKDFENDHDSRRRDNDHDSRRRDIENDHGGRRRDNENDHDGRRRDIGRQDSGKNDYHQRDQGRERNRNDYERNRNDTRSDYDKQDYTDRRNTDYYDQDSSRQQYSSSEYLAPTVNNFSQPPPPLGGSNSIEVFGERRPLSFK